MMEGEEFYSEGLLKATKFYVVVSGSQIVRIVRRIWRRRYFPRFGRVTDKKQG
jgi:hypothetical protein